MVRSAGVSNKSPHQVSSGDLEWADLVLVMERKYQSRILETFRDNADLPPIVSLDIPDDYERMDPELIALIEKGTEFHLKQRFNLEPGPNPVADDEPTAGSDDSGAPEDPPSVNGSLASRVFSAGISARFEAGPRSPVRIGA